MEKLVISVVGKDLFSNRMHIEKEFGEILYDQLIFVLENIAVENPNARYSPTEIRLGVYLDSQNTGERKFEIDEDKSEKFYNLFANKFYVEFKQYSIRQQKLGTDLLFQLNGGNLSMKDFEKRL